MHGNLTGPEHEVAGLGFIHRGVVHTGSQHVRKLGPRLQLLQVEVLCPRGGQSRTFWISAMGGKLPAAAFLESDAAHSAPYSASTCSTQPGAGQTVRMH